MMPLERYLADLIDAVADSASQRSSNGALVVSGVVFDVPMEARIAPDGSLLAGAPRGLLATGFMHPVNRLHVSCEEAS